MVADDEAPGAIWVRRKIGIGDDSVSSLSRLRLCLGDRREESIMTQRKTYHVQRWHDVLGWKDVFGATGGKGFCEGWVTGIDSLYPSPRMRVVERIGIIEKVIFQKPGRDKVHVN